ncbi:MAG: hypothetical protein ACYC38_03215 [Eubacteriales bacterium]
MGKEIFTGYVLGLALGEIRLPLEVVEDGNCTGLSMLPRTVPIHFKVNDV